MPDDTSSADRHAKPSVLIVGGLGYLGRHLAHHIHTQNLSSTLRIVDKILPQLAHLAPEFTPPCGPPYFLQADASREASLPRVFDHPDVPNGKWDIVFNLGGETAWAQSAEVYRLRTTQLSVVLGKECAKRGVGVFVECSTALVYSPKRKPRRETDKVEPWLRLAKAKLEAEQELSKIEGLNLVILRLAHVYGKYDWGFVAKALCLARVYQEQQQELKWLWTEDLRINTVWVGDAVRALWTAALWRKTNSTVVDPEPSSSPKTRRRPTLLGGSKEPASLTKDTADDDPSNAREEATPIFNIVDHGATSQGTLAALVSAIFHIRTGFHGSFISQFAKINLDSVVDDVNDDTLEVWAEICERKGTQGGPLSPFLEKEVLRDCDLSVDGGLFERVTGFEYERARGLEEMGVREMVRSYESMGWWP